MHSDWLKQHALSENREQVDDIKLGRRGVFQGGNPGRRGAIAAWEIQSEREVRNSCYLSGVCVFVLE